MQSKIVRESLFNDTYYENLLLESLNEGFDFVHIKQIASNIKDKKQALFHFIKKFNETKVFATRKYIAGIIIILYLINFGIKTNKWNTGYIDKASIELAGIMPLTLDNVIDITKEEVIKEDKESKILSINSEIIKDINSIKPGRLNVAKIPRYNQHDKEILEAVEILKNKGEDPNPNLLKSIMVLETGMKPIKNKWGFEGFPQTKTHIISSINKRFKTDFTISDMYDPVKSAQFIHYYLKASSKSSYVKNLEDLAIAYNWGIGNLRKYKNGEKELTSQARDYAAMIKVLEKYFS